MRRLVPPLVLACLGLAGCGWLDGLRDRGPVRAPLGRPVTLAPGGRALLGDSTWVLFERVVEDARCPVDANCFIAGRARLRITVDDGRTRRSVSDTVTVGDDGRGRDVTCPSGPGPCVQTVRLAPDLRTSRPVVSPARYRATFVGVPRPR